MLQSFFDSIPQLRDRLKGLELLWGVIEPEIWLHDQEGGHTDNYGDPVFFNGGYRRVTHIGNKYLTVTLSDGESCKIYIEEDFSQTYCVSFNY